RLIADALDVAPEQIWPSRYREYECHSMSREI
ncbi:transcriptional regulator, partial [Salmonella enterica]|nr:transcriptional regulator [Salmonella enterica]